MTVVERRMETMEDFPPIPYGHEGMTREAQDAALIAWRDAERECARLRAQLHEVRLLGELWIRSSDDTTRRLGADLLGVLGVM